MSKKIVLTVHSGTDKRGKKEAYGILTFRTGEIIAVVGATGSGKTRLLADIERLTAGDSPTRRRVTIQGCSLEKQRSGYAVARISQAMQFFLDLTVESFIEMHMRSHGCSGNTRVADVVAAANRLSGESFRKDQPLSSLSGGQARALMVADAVLVSDSPVLLIDEVENAGIDRKAALDFLLEKERIIFIATHDPLIALRSDRRLVFSGGAISKVLTRSKHEESLIPGLAGIDRELQELRDKIRAGAVIGRTPVSRRT